MGIGFEESSPKLPTHPSSFEVCRQVKNLWSWFICECRYFTLFHPNLTRLINLFWLIWWRIFGHPSVGYIMLHHVTSLFPLPSLIASPAGSAGPKRSHWTLDQNPSVGSAGPFFKMGISQFVSQEGPSGSFEDCHHFWYIPWFSFLRIQHIPFFRGETHGTTHGTGR